MLKTLYVALEDYSDHHMLALEKVLTIEAFFIPSFYDLIINLVGLRNVESSNTHHLL